MQLHDLPVPLHSAWSVPHVNNSQCVIPTQFSVFLKQQQNIYISVAILAQAILAQAILAQVSSFICWSVGSVAPVEVPLDSPL